MSRTKDPAGIYKRGNVWWFSYTREGKQYCQSTHKQNRAEAIIYRKEFLDTLEKTTQEQKEGHLFAFVVNELLQELDHKLANNKIRQRTYEEYDYYIMKKDGILDYFKDRIKNNINIQDIKNFERFVLNKGKSDGYLIKHLKKLKSIFNFAFQREYIDRNLFDRYNFLELYNNYQKKEEIYTVNEIKKIIENSNYTLARLIIFLLNVCPRISETLKLLKTDIIIDKNNIMWIIFRAENTKSKKERRIPLNKYARLAVEAQCRDFPDSLYIFTDEKGNYYKTTPKTALQTACRKAGLKCKSFHIFRHTGATLLYNGKNYLGEDIGFKSKEAISELLGHSDLKITDVYINDNQELLKTLLD